MGGVATPIAQEVTMFSTLLAAAVLGAPIAAAGDTPPCLDEQAILGDAAQAFPARYDELMRIRLEDPARFSRLLHATTHVLDDPAMVAAVERQSKAEARLERASAALRQAGDKATGAQEAELLSAAEAVVDAKIAVKRLRLEHLSEEQKLVGQDLRELQQRREADIDALIDRNAR